MKSGQECQHHSTEAYFLAVGCGKLSLFVHMKYLKTGIF